MEGKGGERSGGDYLRFVAKLKNVIRIGILGFGIIDVQWLFYP